MDDGLGGNFTALSSTISPSTFKYNISSGLTIGYNYRIKLIAYNDVGSIIGNIISAIAANVPDTPLYPPSYDKTETNAT